MPEPRRSQASELQIIKIIDENQPSEKEHSSSSLHPACKTAARAVALVRQASSERDTALRQDCNTAVCAAKGQNAAAPRGKVPRTGSLHAILDDDVGVGRRSGAAGRGGLDRNGEHGSGGIILRKCPGVVCGGAERDVEG